MTINNFNDLAILAQKEQEQKIYVHNNFMNFLHEKSKNLQGKKLRCIYRLDKSSYVKYYVNRHAQLYRTRERNANRSNRYIAIFKVNPANLNLNLKKSIIGDQI